MDKHSNITCPNCSHHFDVEDVLASKIHQKLKSEYDQEKLSLNQKIAEQKKELEAEKNAFDEKKKRENQIFKERLEAAVQNKQSELQKSIQEEYQLKIKAQEEELQKKRQQVLDLKQKEIEIEKMQTQMQEMEKDIELKLQKQMRQQLLDREEQIRKRLSEENELRIKEKDQKLEAQKKLIAEMKRKSEQGSVQLQGEVQELAIEEYLSQQFAIDDIEEIKKGARGGDCVQIVNTRLQNQCGIIYYESKRTKEFQPAWIEKFKADMTKIGADIGVIVTQTYPKGESSMCQRKGVWICSFAEFKSLCHVLRETIIRVNAVKKAQENKGDKMELVYNYLTSQEFKLHVEGIIDGFTQMQTDLQKEKNAMQRIWSAREKQIQKVLQNTSTMYGSIQGYAGTSVASLEAFELTEE